MGAGLRRLIAGKRVKRRATALLTTRVLQLLSDDSRNEKHIDADGGRKSANVESRRLAF
jgi:hypothetical protein